MVCIQAPGGAGLAHLVYRTEKKPEKFLKNKNYTCIYLFLSIKVCLFCVVWRLSFALQEEGHQGFPMHAGMQVLSLL